MSDNRSDYSLPRANVHDMLPVINQNPLLKAISEATFNRFLTKPELTRVIGTLGVPSVSGKNDIVGEDSVYNQAYQLQPTIIDNSKSTTDLVTYADVQRIGERLGIDFNAVQNWQDTEQFNYCPPINLDKLINYRDYYWVDTNQAPQYITITNRLVVIQGELSQMVKQYLTLELDTDKEALWPSIERQLNLVYTVVPANQRFVIPNLDLVMADAHHPAYTAQVLGDVSARDYVPASDWARENQWVHKNDVEDLSSAVAATIPIIEYQDTIQLTHWTFTEHLWQYRVSSAFDWQTVVGGPSKAELNNTTSVTSRGDAWLGFQQHWNYLGAKPAVPVSAQVVNNTAQGITPIVAGNGQRVFTTSHTILTGTNILRVYVDGVRQYGTYAEADAHTIEFYDPVAAGAAVELYTEVAALSDVGLEHASPLGLNLVEYRLQEQQKHGDQDYPQFDVVDMHGAPLYESTSIFAFTEDPAYTVHPAIGKRIAYDALTRDYGFTIGLVDGDKNFKFYIDSVDGISSIWKKDKTGAKYVPTKVDATRQPSTAADAVWEIPAPFLNNVHHDCRNSLKFSELFLHLQSIIDAQTTTPEAALLYGNLGAKQYRLHRDINLGAGGSIKEYNYNFANFISALISSEYSPLEVIDFAKDEYERKLIEVRKAVETNLLDILTSEVQSVPDALAKIVVDTLKYDVGQTKLYSDSSVSQLSTVPNWVATLPYLRLAHATKPKVLRDDQRGIMRIVHHDGHVGNDELSTNDNLRRALIANATHGEVTPVGMVGQLWYKDSANQLFRYNGSTWDIVDVVGLVTGVILAIEQALYEGAPKQALRYDTANLETQYPNEFAEQLRIEYESYCKAKKIAQPYKGDFNIADPFTWNYAYVDKTHAVGVNIPVDQKLQAAWSASWEEIYANYYGTSTPHLEPWKLQGYADAPVWWSAQYASTSRKWSKAMWNNIILGIVPAGKLKASGVVSDGLADAGLSVPVVSVNITDRTIAGYAPDALLPPYWPYDTRDANEPNILNQCMLDASFDYLTARIAVNDFPFGSLGPKEVAWRNSTSFIYAKLKIAFKLDPVRFMHYTFGEDYTSIQGLLVCNRTNNVLSHKDVLFHGDANTNGVKQYFEGVNQWYVQLFRNAAMYGSGNSVQQVWTGWDTQLGYNVGGMLVDNTLSLTSSRMDIAPTDYGVKLKRAKKVRDTWVDSLYVTVQQAGSFQEIPHGAGRDWKFDVGVRAPVIRDIPYYAVKKYRVAADAATNTFEFVEDGSLELAGWTTTSAVMLDTGANGLLPNGVDDVTYYSIIPVRDATTGEATRKFMLALTDDDATNNKAIPLLTDGSGVLYVAELASTFYAFEAANTTNLWKHYAVNKNDVRTFSSTRQIAGMQSVVDFVDGYVEYLKDQGYIFNDSSLPEYDENDRLVNWQYELEAMINYIYLQMGSMTRITPSSIGYQIGEIEMNPFRNNLWLDHAMGVISEFTNSTNTATQAYAYDRAGFKIPVHDYHILREDNRTHFTTLSGTNETIQSNVQTFLYDPNTNFAGFHVFFDEYEHTILFNSRTVEGEYIYDPFLGVSIPRVQVYFEKQPKSTKRPNVGGFVLEGDGLTQNFEYTVGNLSKYYDTFTVNENANFVNQARSLLGYKPNATYFQGSTITPKSQFLFYKGMIKAKGTLGSVQAFTSAQQGDSTEVDEFWAYKAFEFGDRRTKVVYTVNLTADDTANNLVKLQFVPTPTTVVDDDFTKIAVSDTSRWYNYPSQMSYLPSVEKLFGVKPSALLNAHAPENGKYAPMVLGAQFGRFRSVVKSINIDGDVQVRKMYIHGSAIDVTVLLTNPLNSTFGAPVRATAQSHGAEDQITFPGFEYMPGTNNIDVYVNGLRTTDFIERSSNSIKLPANTIGVVVVVKKVGTLVEGIHYIRRNSRMIELLANVSGDDIQIVTYVADYSDCTPVKIFDRKTNMVIADVAAWDPMHGVNAGLLDSIVDVASASDPAEYNVNPDVNAQNTRLFWATAEVGKVWKDTGSYDHVPYSETADSKQLVEWGSLSDWSDPAVYQWVESIVSPANWDTTNGTPRMEVYERTRKIWDIVGFDAAGGNIFVTTPFVVGTEVVLFGSDLPAPLRQGVVYTVSTVGQNVIALANRNGSAIVYTNSGSGSMRIAKATYDNTWAKVEQQVEYHEMVEVDFDASTLSHQLPDRTEVSIYANGKYLQDGYTYVVGNQGRIDLEPELIAPFKANAHMYQLTMVTKTGVLDGLPTTRPADLDVTDSESQLYVTTPYARVDHTADDGELPQPLYYFWVRKLVDGNKKSVSMLYAEYMISHNDNPYLIALNPTLVDGTKYLNQLVIAGVHGAVGEEDRYVLSLMKNSTLRDNITNTKGQVLNSVHSQWIMFREKQTGNIDRVLWDKVTESIAGYSLADVNTPVPSLDRAIYDAQHNTSTRFGLNIDQAFVDGKQALDTILAYLHSSTIVFDQIDMDAFLARYNFNSKEAVVTTMNAIYMTFPAKYVNMLFFAVLNDALSNHAVDYSKSLMKTSMVSLSGTYKLNVNGAQDE